MGTKSKKGKTFELHPRWRIGTGKKIALGPGKVELLEFIAETGSIGKAAKKMGMSYIRAWSLIKTMNECFHSPVLVTERGGTARGGATLTDFGTNVLKLYRQLESDSLKATEGSWHSLQKLLRD